MPDEVVADDVVTAQRSYPVNIKGELAEKMGGGLWLIKWLLLIPHYVCLVFLWVAFVVLTVFAFFAILFTGRYPRGIFDFNVGVMRWTWRVGFYGYEALGTNKYPPFALRSIEDYPADLYIDYPERLSRGLVLIKWWLLAIPHYLVVAYFAAASSITGGSTAGWGWASYGGAAGGTMVGGGLISLLVIIAAVVLLFKGYYPKDIYNFVLGMNRWSYRVSAYAALMTDKYPPFRLND
ncbi:DUF4389 domain-containing protein [Chloroflexota bacterium]